MYHYMRNAEGDQRDTLRKRLCEGEGRQWTEVAKKCQAITGARRGKECRVYGPGETLILAP